jgi:HEAT repeat protein
VPVLIESLTDKDRNIRRWAAWTLGKIKDERAARHLITALEDEDGGVQFAAEVALAEMEE